MIQEYKMSTESKKIASQMFPYTHSFAIKLEPMDSEMESGSTIEAVRSVRSQKLKGSNQTHLSFPPVQMLSTTAHNDRDKHHLNSLRDKESSKRKSRVCGGKDLRRRTVHSNSRKDLLEENISSQGTSVVIKKEPSSWEGNDLQDNVSDDTSAGEVHAKSLPTGDVTGIKIEPCDASSNSSENKLTEGEQTNNSRSQETEAQPVSLYQTTSLTTALTEDQKVLMYPSAEWNERFGKKTRSAPKGRSDERPHVCEVCDAAFTQYVYLKRHRRTHSNVKPWKCEQCSKSFIRRSQLQVHERVHSGEKPYKCKRCDASFSQTGHLQVHMRSHTGEKPFPCDKCSAAFTSSSHLNSHIRCVHMDVRPFECLMCGMAFNTPANLRLHCRTHSGEKPYKCDQCGAAFSQSGNLKQHQVRHTWERPHTCQFCGLQFARLALLHQHYYSHQQELEENSFACPECDEKYQNAGLLHVHIKKDHGVKRTYRCKYCSSTFTQSCNLKRHVLTHSGFKPFPCSQCDTAFTQHSHLQRHMKRIHSDGTTDKRPHKCSECLATFVRVSDLKRHGKLHIIASVEDEEQSEQMEDTADVSSVNKAEVSSADEAAVCSSAEDQLASATVDNETGESDCHPINVSQKEVEEDSVQIEQDAVNIGSPKSDPGQLVGSGNVAPSGHNVQSVDDTTPSPGPDDTEDNAYATDTSSVTACFSTGEVVFPNMADLHRYKFSQAQ